MSKQTKRIDAETAKHTAAFKARGHAPKKSVLGFIPGAFIQVKYLDGPDEVVLLLEKPVRGPGDISLRVLREHGVMTTVEHDQVIALVGYATWPTHVC